MKNQALVIVDFQNEYFSSVEGSKIPLLNSEEASKNASKILEFFRKKDLNIIHVKHEIDSNDAPYFKKGTLGTKIHKSLSPLENEKVITKAFPNSFLETDLKQTLDKLNIDSLVIIGAMSHMCIDATVRAAKDFAYDCTIVSDACATKDLEFENLVIPAKYVHGTIMAAFEFAYGKVVNTKDILKGVDN